MGVIMRKILFTIIIIATLNFMGCESDNTANSNADTGTSSGGETIDPLIDFTWNDVVFTDGTNIIGTIPIYINSNEAIDLNKCQFRIERDYGGNDWQTEYFWNEGNASGGGHISLENNDTSVSIRLSSNWQFIGGGLTNYRISGYVVDLNNNTSAISVINFISDD